MTESPGDNAGVIAFPPLLWSGPLVLGLLLHWLFPLHLPVPWPARVGGVVLALASGALAKWGEITLKRAGTNVHPGQPTLAIVTAGPYRFTRNPLYLSLAGLYLGVTLAVATAWPLLWFPVLVVITQYGIIRREERYLAAKFGEPYIHYLQRVRRWF
jgi:protein-S-isoprenylcysteine O-methyltransferase Ste14